MRRLAQSTAYTVVFKVFLSSDHVSAATGKTVAITLSKAGAAFGNPAAGASNATEISGGWYKFALGTGDTDTLGDLILVGTATSCDTADIPMMVVSATTGGATNLDAAITSRMATYTQPTGFLAATFPATVASTTNITAGTITTVSTVTGLTASDVGSIKTKTDSLTFTVSGIVDSNIQYVNDVLVNGTGASGDEWGP